MYCTVSTIGKHHSSYLITNCRICLFETEGDGDDYYVGFATLEGSDSFIPFTFEINLSEVPDRKLKKFLRDNFDFIALKVTMHMSDAPHIRFGHELKAWRELQEQQ